MSLLRQEHVHAAAEKYAQHINPAFVRLLGTFGYGRVFVRAEGMTLWDAEGREYLDFLGAFGAANLGHNPPRLLAAIREHLTTEAPSLVHVGPQVHAAELGAALAARVPELPMVMLSLSGGEAVESALKLARAATGRPGLLSCEGGFHGTGFGNLSVMGHGRMRAPFGPLLPGCRRIPYGDLDALDRALGDRAQAAFLVEPIAAEAGIIVPPDGYLRDSLELCRRHGTLLVLDEVQTGLGRTGRLFAHQWEQDAVPDVLVLGKSLGGSVVPVSAALTTAELHRRAFGTAATFDLHGSTFSGYSLGCAAALATLAILDEEGLAERAERAGRRMLDALRARLGGHPLVRDIRGRGLLLGLELGPTRSGLLNRLAPGLVSAVSEKVFGQWLALRLLEEGILCQPASQQWNVLRLEPPLIVTDPEIDRVVDTIARVLGEYRELAPLLADVGRRLGRQLGDGWRFG